MELEKKYNEPHSFTSFKVGTTQYECSYCHHAIRDKEGKAVPFERGGKRVRDCTAFYCISFYLSLSLSPSLSLSLSLPPSLSTAFKCKNCSCTCHNYCKRHMPSNCGTLSLIGGGRQQLTTPIPEAVRNELFTNHNWI